MALNPTAQATVTEPVAEALVRATLIADIRPEKIRANVNSLDEVRRSIRVIDQVFQTKLAPLMGYPLRNVTFEDAHLDVSKGAADRGQPIKLDADGTIDASMINASDLDDTFVRRDGTTALTAPWAANNDITGLTKLEVDDVRIDGGTIEHTTGTLTIAAGGLGGGVIIQSSGASPVVIRSTQLSVEGLGEFDSFVQATQLKSTIATGTAPLVVASTTVVANLNADLLDGNHGNVLRFFNGTFLESFDALVTSDGATVTMTLTNDVSGNLTMVFSDGQTIFDLSGSDGVIALTAGSDTSPTENFVYILKSDKILTVSTSGWPTAEHIRIGFFFVPSAGFVQSHGVYVNHNMNDHASDQATALGHLSHITERIRAQSAIYKSGVVLIVTPSSGGTVVDVAVTAGLVFQMHPHATPALDTATGDTVLVVNQNGAAFDDVHDLETLTNDSAGVAVKKYFNWVFWGTANKSDEFAPMMLNLSNGSYVKLDQALADVSGFDVLTMPAAFNSDSSTGFLIARVTMSLSGGVFAVESTVDLRGSTPQSVAGGGVGGQETEFADNQFLLFDETDATKELVLQLSGIATGTRRVITMANQNIDLTPGTGSFATEAEGNLAATAMQDLIDDTTPELGGELDAGAHTIGFTLQTATGDGTTTIDWRLGNKFKFTWGAQAETFTFTAPSNPCNVVLEMKQDGTGGRDATLAMVTWLGTVPVFPDGGANKTIIALLYYNGTKWWGTITPWET